MRMTMTAATTTTTATMMPTRTTITRPAMRPLKQPE